MDFSKHILPSGARVVLVPMREAQTVLFQVLSGAGSHYETKKQGGISHFLEHILFKGTANRPNSRVIAEEIDRVGGEINAFTGKEQTGYWARVAKQHWSVALEVISDLYLNPLLKPEEINKERGVILQEAAMYRDMPAAYVWDVFEKLLFGDQPAGRSIVGEEKNIKSFQRKDFSEYLKNHYGCQNTVVVAAGNFDQSVLLDKVSKTFSSSAFRSRQRLARKLSPVKKGVDSEAVAFFPKKADQAQFVLGAEAADMLDEKRYAEKLLAVALGEGMSSRLFLNIREKRGLCYRIAAGNEQNLNSGYFHISAGVDPQRLPLTLKLVLSELKKIKTRKLSLTELKKVKEYYKGKVLMALESPEGAAGFFAGQELFRGKIETEERLLEKIDRVSAEDILRSAERIFLKEKLKLAVVAENFQEKEIKGLLKNF